MMKFLQCTVLTTLLLSLSYAARAADLVGVAATVGNSQILERRLQYAVNDHLRQRGIDVGAIRQPGEFSEIRERVLNVLIGQELLWQAARDAGTIASEADVDAEIEAIRATFESELALDNHIHESGHTRTSFRHDVKQRLSVQQWIRNNIRVEIGDDEVTGFYDDNRERFAIPERIHARHILVTLSPDSSQDEKQLARARLREIRAEAQSGRDFAELAHQHSDDSSAVRGGDLGYFLPGQMVAPFEQAAFALAPGEISSIVETRFGLHLIQCVDRKPASHYSLEAVAERIRAYLQQRKYHASLETAVQQLSRQTDVEIHNL